MHASVRWRMPCCAGWAGQAVRIMMAHSRLHWPEWVPYCFAAAPQVVGQSADVVAVCKPHGMPVHVAGQYRKNTVHGILTAERPELGPLFPVHRCVRVGRCGRHFAWRGRRVASAAALHES